jgi:hypothetical protein
MRENLLKMLKQTVIPESEVTPHGHGFRPHPSMKVSLGLRAEDFWASPQLAGRMPALPGFFHGKFSASHHLHHVTFFSCHGLRDF